MSKRVSLKSLIWLLIVVLSLNQKELFAQDRATIYGTILDKETQKPIPFTNVQIENEPIGVISNEDGKFKISVDRKYNDSNLLISLIGYASKTIKISDIKETSNILISLSSKTFYIDEIQIKPKVASEVVIEAIDNIPNNYSKANINFSAYYRELMQENNKYIWMADAACDFYLSPYGNDYYNIESIKQFYDASTFRQGAKGCPLWQIYDNSLTDPNDQVKIIESRSSDNLSQSISKFDIMGGPMGLLALDKVNYNLAFLSKGQVKKYVYHIDTITNYLDRRIYIISFNTIKKQYMAYKGKLYIDALSKAIIKIEYESDLSKTNKRSSFKIDRYDYYNSKRIRDYINYNKQEVTIEYRLIDSVWYLNYIKESREIDYTYKKENITQTIKTNRELLVNNIITNNVVKFKPDEIFKNNISSVLFENNLTYNEKFWNHYNLILASKELDSIKKDLEENTKLSEQFKKLKVDTLKPPLAKTIPFYDTVHNDIRIDNYHWLQDIKDKDVLRYINKENDYTNNYFVPLRELQRSIYYEIKSELDIETNYPDSIKKGSYIYYWSTEKGKDYDLLYRRKNEKGSKEELLVDENELAKNSAYFNLTDWHISDDNKTFVYGIDYTGEFKLKYYFLDIDSKIIIDSLYDIQNFTYSKTGECFLYTKSDSTLRNYKVYLHYLRTAQDSDKMIYHEKDTGYDLYLKKTTSEKYMKIFSSSSSVANRDKKFLIDFYSGEPNLVQLPSGILENSYEVNHINHKFYFYLKNSKQLVSCDSVSDIFNNNFKLEYQSDKDAFLSYRVFKDYIAILERNQMLYEIKIKNIHTNEIKSLDFKEATHCIYFPANQSFSDNKLIFRYSSLKTPLIKYELDLNTKKKKKVYKKEINNYDPNKYKTKLLWVTAEDSVKIPVSIVYKKDIRLKNHNFLYLTAYGSYGKAYPTSFNGVNLSLIDRGFIFAIAHIRGGSELGQNWDTAGSLLNKKTTFSDFISCLNYLIQNNYTDTNKIAIEGGSAGGLLMAYVANNTPNLVNTIILSHPFVDVTNSLLDTTDAFSTAAFYVFGNPAIKKYYNYINSYSPYDNIKKQNYPNMLFTGTMQDQRVKYWEATKMVAKLRAYKQDNNILLLKTEMNGNHFGGSGKYSYWNENAFKFAFILHNLNLK